MGITLGYLREIETKFRGIREHPPKTNELILYPKLLAIFEAGDIILGINSLDFGVGGVSLIGFVSHENSRQFTPPKTSEYPVLLNDGWKMIDFLLTRSLFWGRSLILTGVQAGFVGTPINHIGYPP